MKWTCESFLKYSKEKRNDFKKNYPTSDKPKKLFKLLGSCKKNYEDYIFSEKNWNDTDILREYIEEKMESTGCRYITSYHKGTYAYIFFTCADDIKHATIVVMKSRLHDTYEISWYKNRGRTSSITKNGRLISLPDYVGLLNIINEGN